MYFLGEMWSDEDVGYFLNETFKTVDYHGWLTKKKKKLLQGSQELSQIRFSRLDCFQNNSTFFGGFTISQIL